MQRQSRLLTRLGLVLGGEEASEKDEAEAAQIVADVHALRDALLTFGQLKCALADNCFLLFLFVEFLLLLLLLLLLLSLSLAHFLSFLPSFRLLFSSLFISISLFFMDNLLWPLSKVTIPNVIFFAPVPCFLPHDLQDSYCWSHFKD